MFKFKPGVSIVSTIRVRWSRAWKFEKNLCELYFPYIMVMPLLILIGAIFIYPLSQGIILSFFNTEGDFVALGKYQSLFHDSEFWHSLIITFIYVAVYTAGIFFVGFVSAFTLWHGELRKVSGTTAASTLILLPYAIPDVVASLLWLWILDPSLGVMNYLLKSIGFINTSIMWISDPGLALYSVILVTIWRLFPLHTMIILAAFRSVPQSMLEAAELDGAGPLHKFLNIILPNTKNTLVILLILTIVWSFKRFTILWLMTGGGPSGASETTMIYLYQQAFKYFNKNYASAIGVVLLIIVVFIATVIFFLSRSESGEEVSFKLR